MSEGPFFVYSLYSKPHFQHKLSNGELIIVNNLRFAHGRTPYKSDGVRQSTIFLYGLVDNEPMLCQEWDIPVK